MKLVVRHPTTTTAALGTQRQQFVLHEARPAVLAHHLVGVTKGARDVARGYAVWQLQHAPVDIITRIDLIDYISSIRPAGGGA